MLHLLPLFIHLVVIFLQLIKRFFSVPHFGITVVLHRSDRMKGMAGCPGDAGLLPSLHDPLILHTANHSAE